MASEPFGPVLISPGSNLLPWVVASIALYTVATNLAALGLRRSGSQGRLARLSRSASGRLAGWFVWMGWLIGPAYAALLLGDLSPRLMGLTQIDLGAGLGKGILFAALSLAVLVGAVLTYRRVAPASQPYASVGHALLWSTGLVLAAGALQFHWAFYRSAAIQAATTLGWPTPIYWGSWLAAGGICLEGALSPFLWRDLRTSGRAEIRVLRGVLLAATTVVYLLSRNFWLAWVLHAVATVILEPRLAGGENTDGMAHGSHG